MITVTFSITLDGHFLPILYVAKGREKLGLNEVQAVLLIMDVFKGQMTDPVLKVLPNNNILLQSRPLGNWSNFPATSQAMWRVKTMQIVMLQKGKNKICAQ